MELLRVDDLAVQQVVAQQVVVHGLRHDQRDLRGGPGRRDGEGEDEGEERRGEKSRRGEERREESEEQGREARQIDTSLSSDSMQEREEKRKEESGEHRREESRTEESEEMRAV